MKVINYIIYTQKISKGRQRMYGNELICKEGGGGRGEGGTIMNHFTFLAKI
jgi:hypothetical protein